MYITNNTFNINNPKPDEHMEDTVNNLGTSALINDSMLPECCSFFSPIFPSQSGFIFLEGKIHILYLPFDKENCLKGLNTTVKIALPVPGFVHFSTRGYIYNTLAWMQSTRQHD